MHKKRTGAEQDFYRTRAWKTLSLKVRRHYKHECQECKKLGKLTRAVLVHHDKSLRDYPEFGMEMFVDGKPQLIPLCFDCHERIETERGNRGSAEPLTAEWDGSGD